MALYGFGQSPSTPPLGQGAGQYLPADVYAYGVRTRLGGTNDLYNYAAQLVASGKPADQVAQELSNNPFGVSYQELAGTLAAGGAGADSGGSSSYGGTASGGANAGYINGDLTDKINALNQLYDLLSNDVGSLAKSKRSDLENQYGKQTADLTKQYETNQAVMPNAFAANGIANSSYLAREAGNAADQYNQGLTSIEDNKQQGLAQIGQQYQSALSGYQSAKANLAGADRNFYGTAGDYKAAQQSYDQQANSLAAQRGGLMTNSQYAQTLNGIAPVQNTSTSALQEQLSKITQSSIPGYAKDTIAKGLIKQSGQDPNFYTDYYEKVKSGIPAGA